MNYEKRYQNKLLAVSLLVLSLSLCGWNWNNKKERSKDIAVLYTNDVHCAADTNIGYSGLAAFKNELEADGTEVLLVDAGDSIQGAPIGSLSKGIIPIETMNELGYCAMTLGNHEFDYGLDALKALSEQADFPFLSLNFVDKKSGKPVYQPYIIVDRDGIKIAFIGVTTPHTLTSSTPTFFMDDNGDYKYFFLQDDSGAALWSATQQVVDTARENGADYVIALTHLGIESSQAPYLSTNLIANTSGIDVVLDGHSHSVIECERVKNKEGKRTLLSSTGAELNHIGYLLLDRDGNISTGLISAYEENEEKITAYINSLQAELQERLKQTVATVTSNLIVEDPKTGVRLIRNAETNLGDLCADAIRSATGADVAVINGGGIRTNLMAGSITYGDVLKVFPFGNRLQVIQVTGQQLLDALELSVSTTPSENGGFLQVSGLMFEFCTDIPSSVMLNNDGMFNGINGTRRVQNVFVNGRPLNPDAIYTLAGTKYTLIDGGDGYTMFADCPVVKEDVALDFDALVGFLTGTYLQNTTAYTNPYGEGRISSVQ